MGGGVVGEKGIKCEKQIEHIAKAEQKQNKGHKANFPLPLHPTAPLCGFISKLYCKTGLVALAIQGNARSLSYVLDDNTMHFDGVL